MTPARSLAASVVALGFAGTLAGPPPAAAAPAPCERAENYAAQSGAELLRIDRLSLRPAVTERPTAPEPSPSPSSSPEPPGATERILHSGAEAPGPDAGSSEDSDTLSEGIGIAGQALLGQILPGGASTLAGDDTTDSADSPTSVDEAGYSDPDSGGTRVERASAQRPERSRGGEADDAGPGTTTHGPEQNRGRDADHARPGTTTHSPEQNRGRETDGGGPAAETLRDVGLGEARTALVGTARINSAAVARILDGRVEGKPAWSEPLLQQAPPTNERAATRTTPSGRIGPLAAGGGRLSAHARWDAGMACGSTVGEAARARASMRSVSILGGRGGALVRVPEKVTGMSTTALERRGENARTVASATVAAGRIELAGGKVKVRVLRPPVLDATMSADEGGAVRYRPPLVEVSGDGITTRRLETPGDHVDVSLDPDRHVMESGGRPGRSGLGDVRPGSALPLPQVPGLPQVPSPSQVSGLPQVPGPSQVSGLPQAPGPSQVSGLPQAPGLKRAGEPATESVQAAGSGMRLRISLGAVRQAARGHAIAAKAVAIRVTITLGGTGRATGGYGGAPRTTAALDLAVGLLEVAAVTPERATAGTPGGAGGLPVTGPSVVGLAMAGATLLLAGAAALLVGLLRGRSRP